MTDPTVGGVMPERGVDPSVYRRRLRNILRRTRDSKGITQLAAALAMSWSVSKLIRIETGAVTISVNDLKALLALYGISEPEKVDELIDMAKKSRQQRNSWLAVYRNVASDVFLTFLGHEDAAVESYSFQPVLVPGLLQTDEYAAEVLKVLRGSQDPARIRRLIELRTARQDRVFSRTDGIKLNYLLDESVVRRAVGSAELMKRQVIRLIDACGQDNLSIRIIPFGAGVYRSMRVPFVVLEFSRPEDEAVLYLEYPQGESLIREDEPSDVGDAGVASSPPTSPPTYVQIFNELRDHTSDVETLEILQSALTDLGN